MNIIIWTDQPITFFLGKALTNMSHTIDHIYYQSSTKTCYLSGNYSMDYPYDLPTESVEFTPNHGDPVIVWDTDSGFYTIGLYRKSSKDQHYIYNIPKQSYDGYSYSHIAPYAGPVLPFYNLEEICHV